MRPLPGRLDKAHAILSDLVERGKGADDVPRDIDELEETLRMTSICGLGQVALGPVLSVLGWTAAAPRRGPTRRTARTPRRSRALTGRRPTRSSSPSGPLPRRSRASGRPGAPPLETVALRGAHGRVPAEPVVAPHDLPGFARSTVDGFAVRAADTYGASEGLPSSSSVTGAVAMGACAGGRGRPGRARSRCRPAA